MSELTNVVVLGGGFSGLESIFYLRYSLGKNVNLNLVSDEDYFLYKPNIIYVPFGDDPERYKIPLKKPASKKNIKLVKDKVKNIYPDSKKVELENGEIGYDILVVATGAAMLPEEIPGLKEHALTLWTPEEMLELREGLGKVVEKAGSGEKQRILFLVPPNNRCSGPLYEIVMMTDTWLRDKKVRESVDITWTTMEESYIQAFGPRLNTVVTEEFEERGIHGHKGFVVTHVEPGVVHYQNGEKRNYDLLITFPPYIAKENYEGLPHDERGFIHVDPDSRRVKGFEDIFAAGDASDFPIKQAFLALLQADAAAEHIAAQIKGKKPEIKFEPMSMCIMEELNKATFAKVPLKYTEDPMKPVSVDTMDSDNYMVGVSPVWRMGKKVLALYLPWRFGSGEPFHAGFAWNAMDLGLKVMAGLLAH